MELPRLQVSPRLREIMAYPKLAGTVPRLLILQGQYWLDAACENAAKTRGWEVRAVPTHMEGVLTRNEIAPFLDALVTFRPDFVLTINHSGMDTGGLFARLFEDVQVPLVTWFVDDPRTILMGNRAYASAYSVALAWDSAYENYLRDTGFPSVHWMPLAADATIFDAEPADSWQHPPTFVGNSMEEFAERAWKSPALDAALLDTAEQAFEIDCVTRRQFGLGIEAILGRDITPALNAEQARAVEMLFFIEGTRRLRRHFIARLRQEGLHVRGDTGWESVVPNVGPPLAYATELPAFYRQCPLNFNLTSIQMPNAVNQRVFDCPAAGGFLLTDAQPDLGRLFDVTQEVAQYTNLEECITLFRWYRDHPEARKPIIEKARRRVLGEHTYMHRLQQITAIVRERFG